MYLKHHATPVLCSNAIAAVDCSSELSSCQHSDFITCHSANSAIYLPQIKHRLAHFTGTRTHKTQQQTFLPPNGHVFFQMFIIMRSLSIGIGKIMVINDWIMVSFQALQYFRLITIKEIMTFLYQTNLQTGKKYSTVAQISYGLVPVYMNSLSACLFQLSRCPAGFRLVSWM